VSFRLQFDAQLALVVKGAVVAAIIEIDPHAASFPPEEKTTRDNAAARRVAPCVSFFIVILILLSSLVVKWLVGG
jgi:hypothetical protein